LEYDDVMNIQREAIYSKRNNALAGDRLSVDLNNMFTSLTENLVIQHRQSGDFESFRKDSLRLVGIDPDIEAIDFIEGDEMEVIEHFQSQFMEFYDRKSAKIAEILLPVVKDVFENEGHRYKRISIPFTDGRSKPLGISAGLEEAVNSNGSTIMKDIEKAVALSIIDESWKEHLRSMDELKESVQAASFEQKDPLVVYKMEAFGLFEELIYQMNEQVTAYLAKGSLKFPEGRNLQEAKEQKTDLSNVSMNKRENPGTATGGGGGARAAAESVSRRQKPETFKRSEKKVGRNEPCPCGSGKKFKQCHGKR